MASSSSEGHTGKSNPTDAIITLDVGGRRFRTRESVLRESEYLNAQVSRWNQDRQTDGSYFIDTDPDLFSHLLAFMRRPERFPLFWNRAGGFDYELYSKLQMEANYFGVVALADWIEKKKFLDTVKLEVKKKAGGLDYNELGKTTYVSGDTILDTQIASGGLGSFLVVTVKEKVIIDEDVLTANG